jgi:dihydrofolate synthase / folylpolyglutamate synthase
LIAEVRTLQQWLDYIEEVHPRSIALGLVRVGRVRQALGLDPSFPIVTVGGTNGKGSVCAMLEAILCRAGYTAGCYTSPHLLRYNERVRIAGAEASDAELSRAFAAVEQARLDADVPLTYFEFGTLAAVWHFAQRGVDAAILEVGLGGRLDAVNVFDAHCAVIVSVGIDHVEYLGADRGAIGFEKAGIFRAGRPAVCADPDPPRRLTDWAAALGTGLLVVGRDFGATPRGAQWQYWGPRGKRHALPYPALRGACQLTNAAAAIAALDCLRDRLPVTVNDIRAGLLQVEIPGRFQVLPGQPAVILDVAHNPHAALSAVRSLAGLGGTGRTLAVFAMLQDKDVAGVVSALKGRVAHWFVAALPGPRGAPAGALCDALGAAGVAHATDCGDVPAAFAQACDMATENDRILVFGSFHTVAAVMQVLNSKRASTARGDVRSSPKR